MAEIFSGGYAVEYVCRVVDETDGKESVPETATMAQTNLNGKKNSTSAGKKGAADASDSKTDALLNPALQVAMPALNGLTDGVAGQVIGKTRQVINVGKAIASGAGKGAVLGALAPLVAMLVAQGVNAYMNERSKNEALAESIDQVNLKRQAAGLEKINYTQSRVLKKIRLEESR